MHFVSHSPPLNLPSSLLSPSLTANTATFINFIINSLKHEFCMSDLHNIHHFLGINVHRNKHWHFHVSTTIRP